MLVIMPWLPFPLLSGGNQACFNAIKAICNDYTVNVAFLSYSDKDISTVEQLKSVLPQINIFRFQVKKNLRYYFLKFLQKVFADKVKLEMSFDPLIYNKKDFFRYIKTIIRQQNISIVQCEFLPTLEYVYWLRKEKEMINDKSKISIVYVHHEIRFIRNLQSINGYNSNAYQTIAKKLKEREVAALKEYDMVITLSEQDCDYLRKEGVSRIKTSFSIIDNHYKKLPQNDSDIAFAILGSDQHIPNHIGLEWFCNKILPNCDAVDIKVIGRWSQENISYFKSQYPNIHFLGYVDNLEESLKDSVLLVPLTIGSGIRMKIIEAASMGVPVISTSIGASGLPFENGKDILIADTPIQFRDAMNFVKDRKRRKQLSDSIYEKQKKMFSLETLRENRLEIYDSLEK